MTAHDSCERKDKGEKQRSERQHHLQVHLVPYEYADKDSLCTSHLSLVSDHCLLS